MKTIRTTLLWIAASCAALHAQTIVTATVVDANGDAWANGTYQAMYQGSPAFPGPLINNLAGTPVNPASITGTLDATGSFSISLIPSQNVIGPAGAISGVKFTVCSRPLPSACFTTAAVPIQSTGPQSVSAQIASAIIPPSGIAGSGPNVSAYSDSEVNGVAGAEYFRLSDSSFRCYTSSWTMCNGNPAYWSFNSSLASNLSLSANLPLLAKLGNNPNSSGGLIVLQGGTLALPASPSAQAVLIANLSSSAYSTVTSPAGSFGTYYLAPNEAMCASTNGGGQAWSVQNSLYGSLMVNPGVWCTSALATASPHTVAASDGVIIQAGGTVTLPTMTAAQNVLIYNSSSVSLTLAAGGGTAAGYIVAPNSGVVITDSGGSSGALWQISLN